MQSMSSALLPTLKYTILECFKTSKTEPERYIELKTDASNNNNDLELMRLLKEHYVLHVKTGPVVLFTDTNGNHMMGSEDNENARSSLFTNFVARHFRPMCGQPTENEELKDFTIGTTLIRFFHASKNTQEVYKLQKRLNEIITPFAHGKIDIGIHSTYCCKLPSPE